MGMMPDLDILTRLGGRFYPTAQPDIVEISHT